MQLAYVELLGAVQSLETSLEKTGLSDSERVKEMRWRMLGMS